MIALLINASASTSQRCCYRPILPKENKKKRRNKMQVFSVSLESFLALCQKALTCVCTHMHMLVSTYTLYTYIYIHIIYKAIRMFSMCTCVCFLLSPPLTTFRCSCSLYVCTLLFFAWGSLQFLFLFCVSSST